MAVPGDRPDRPAGAAFFGDSAPMIATPVPVANLPAQVPGAVFSRKSGNIRAPHQ